MALGMTRLSGVAWQLSVGGASLLGVVCCMEGNELQDASWASLG